MLARRRGSTSPEPSDLTAPHSVPPNTPHPILRADRRRRGRRAGGIMAARRPRHRSKRPAGEPDSDPGVDDRLDQDLRALVRLLARQAARDWVEREAVAPRDGHSIGGQ